MQLKWTELANADLDGIPYTVVYRVVKAHQEVQILRVLHDAQQWPSAGRQ